MTGFTIGQHSLAELDPVHPRLRGVIKRAIQLTAQDFTVVQGARTQAQAEKNLASGTSRTSNSLHLLQPDGYAHAVDLGAWIDGKIAYLPISAYFAIADAVRQAARDLGVTIRWGGQWDTALNNLKGDLAHESQIYAETFRKTHGRAALADYGHFELPRGVPVSADVKA